MVRLMDCVPRLASPETFERLIVAFAMMSGISEGLKVKEALPPPLPAASVNSVWLNVPRASLELKRTTTFPAPSVYEIEPE